MLTLIIVFVTVAMFNIVWMLTISVVSPFHIAKSMMFAL